MQDTAQPGADGFDLGINILLVDDQPADLLALRVILDELGHNLVEARSGETALCRLQEAEYAVILLDVRMHGLDGFETAKHIRSQAKTRRTPIIFLTGYSDDRFPVEQAYALGAVDYLVKPLVPVILRAKVAGFVELFQKTVQVQRQAEQLRQLERREFEQRLAQENARFQESEQRFARFMQHFPGLAWIKDVQGRYIYANDTCEKAFGVPRTHLYGKTDRDIFPAGMAAVFQENDQLALAEGGVQVIETLQHADGIPHHSVVSKFPVLGQDGQVALVGGMAIDITEQLRVEEALRIAKENLQIVTDSMSAPVSRSSRDLRYLWVSKPYADWVGRQRGEIMGRPILDIIGEAAFEQLRPHFEQVLAGTPVEYEEEVNFRGLGRRWIHAIYTPTFDASGQPDGWVAVVLDLTDRKRTEEALQKSEQRFRFLYEASKLLASSLDYELTLKAVAELAVPALADWCAVDVLQEDQSIQRVAVVHPDPAKVQLGYELLRRYPLRLEMPEGAVLRHGQSVLRAEVTEDMLVRYARDAEHLAILRQLNLKSTMVVPLAARGQILGAVSLVSDRPERRYGRSDLALAEELARRAALAVDNARLYRSTQAALHQREELLALLDTLQNHAPVGFAFVDRQFRFIRINEALAAINGAPAADHLGRSVQDMIPQLWPTLELLYRQVLDQGQPIINLELAGETPARPGELRQFQVCYYPVRLHGQVAGLGVLVTDITERKQAEQAVRDSEEQYRRIVETANEGIWVLDAQARITFINPRMAEMLGYRAEEMLGKVKWEFLFEEDQARVRQLFERRRAGITEQADVRFRHRDGREVWTIMAACPVTDLQGRFTGALDMFTDVTDRKHAEQALQDAGRRKDEFLAMLAHELRNPLAPVRTALQIMKLPGVQAEKVQQARDIMGRQVQHLVRLVDDLLDVSRILRNRIELRKETLDLSTIFARAAEIAQPALDAHAQVLRISLPPSPIRLEGDPVRLAQVLGNLLLNAAKYSDEPGCVELIAERDGGEAVIRVRDNGIGIEPELLPHVFDLFTQADRSLVRSKGGLGIGLTLVKQLVEMHGGQVYASSWGVGRGSEFTIRLPVLPDSANLPTKRSGEEVGPADCPRRVLVVDDNVDAAESMATLLHALGHTVKTVHDGPSALEAVRSFRPEVVLLDIGLPGMSGLDVARALRAQPENRDLLLVAVTGYGQEEDRRRSGEAGFQHHLVKPVAPAELCNLLYRLQKVGCAQ
jgi:PAS domain S-box-containing protein